MLAIGLFVPLATFITNYYYYITIIYDYDYFYDYDYIYADHCVYDDC